MTVQVGPAGLWLVFFSPSGVGYALDNVMATLPRPQLKVSDHTCLSCVDPGV